MPASRRVQIARELDEQDTMLPAHQVAAVLGISRAQLRVLDADPGASFPPAVTYSPSKRGWRFYRRREICAWLASRAPAEQSG